MIKQKRAEIKRIIQLRNNEASGVKPFNITNFASSGFSQGESSYNESFMNYQRSKSVLGVGS